MYTEGFLPADGSGIRREISKITDPWSAAALESRTREEIMRLEPLVNRIRDHETHYRDADDDRLQEAYGKLRTSETRENEAYLKAISIMSVAIERTTGLQSRDTQLMAAILMHEGRVVEQKTGEGKTLSFALAAAADAVEGRGVHVMTATNYLSQRDARWMGQAYDLVGLEVGVIQSNQEHSYRVHGNPEAFHAKLESIAVDKAYSADIVYGPFQAFGHDYLFDHLLLDPDAVRQRSPNGKVLTKPHSVLIDEASQIMLNEALTPLIISGDIEETDENRYRTAARLAGELQRGIHYQIIDHNIKILEAAHPVAEQRFGIASLFDGTHPEIAYLTDALVAKEILYEGEDYIIQSEHGSDGERKKIVVINKTTGYPDPHKQLAHGLHQAVEAKEKLDITSENSQQGEIMVQSYLTRYDKIAGGDGTIASHAEEIQTLYDTDVVVLPTHLEHLVRQKKLTRRESCMTSVLPDVVLPTGEESPKIFVYEDSYDSETRYYGRGDLPNLLYYNRHDQQNKIVESVADIHNQRRPVLVIAPTVEEVDQISALLTSRNIDHQTLTAENAEQDAEIISQAGQLDQVVVATPIAARGIDIKPGGDPNALADQAVKKTGTGETSQEEIKKIRKQCRRICEQERTTVVEKGGLHLIITSHGLTERWLGQTRGRIRPDSPGTTQVIDTLDRDFYLAYGGGLYEDLVTKYYYTDSGTPLDRSDADKIVSKVHDAVHDQELNTRRLLRQYEDVLTQQRNHLYGQRERILFANREQMNVFMQQMIDSVIQDVFTSVGPHPDTRTLLDLLTEVFPLPDTVHVPVETTLESELNKRDQQGNQALISRLARRHYQRLQEKLSLSREKFLALTTIDNLWIQYLTDVMNLRHGIGLRAFGNQNPDVSYVLETSSMYRWVLNQVPREIVGRYFELITD